ncbi:hypothetical protein BC829DRAFT_379932 [Chytridium lagenaria]|nr:hypothetical protein BC829DRAFT_379932 [Chytridium lagenaria]
MATLHTQLGTLKKTQQSQIAKLSNRAEGDVEIMTELRSFMKEKAKIEEEYGKSLEKLARTYLSKKFKKGPVLPKEAFKTSGLKRELSATATLGGDVSINYSMEDGSSVREVYQVYLDIMKATERLGKSRIIISEKIATNISEVLKDTAKEKAIILKKGIDFLGKYQQDMHTAYDELDKVKSVYDKFARETEAAQKKYDSTSAKPNSGLNALRNMMTRTDSDERLEKLRGKWKDSSSRLSEVRNDYLLALQSAMLSKKSIILIISQICLKGWTVLSTQHFVASPTSLWIWSDHCYHSLRRGCYIRKYLLKVDANGDIKTFLNDYATLFNTPPTLSFETSIGDDTSVLVVDESTKEKLGQKLSTLNVEESEVREIIDKKERDIRNITVLADAYKETPQYTGGAGNPIEQKLELEGSLRIAELKRQRILAQIKLLEDAGVSPVKLGGAVELSQARLARDSTDFGRRNGASRFRCIYSYSAREDIEVSVKEGDEVQTLESEKDGWVKVRVLSSQAEGFVPFDYLEAVEKTEAKSLSRTSLVKETRAVRKLTAMYDFNAKDSSELSFKGGDTIEVTEDGDAPTEESWWVGRNVRTGKSGTFPLVYTSGWETGKPDMLRPKKVTPTASPRTSVSRVSNSRLSVAPATKPRPFSTAASSSSEKVKALYQYKPTCEGELALNVGDVITIISKNTGSDAWWEGEGPNGRGQFPVNHVETLSAAVDTTFTVRAVFDYKAQDSGELSFKTGDFIKVLDTSDKDWWKGQFRSTTGLFPASYVEKKD